MKLKTGLLALGVIALIGCSGVALAQSEADIDSMKQQLAEVMKQREGEKAHLENFDDLDFNVYSNQRWEQLGRSHAKDIVVHYPDGSTTTGLEPHIAALAPMFVFAPDHKIVDHPIRIASGHWTAVMGTMVGTFSKPMVTGNGTTISPTGKAFKLNMVTIGRWDGTTMAEEWLFWDNQTFMKQIGLVP